MALISHKWQNEVAAYDRVASGSSRDKWAQKSRNEYIKRVQAHTHDYWTRETMLDAIGKCLENNNFEPAQAVEFFGEFSDEELIKYYFDPLPVQYQPRGTSTPAEELLIAPHNELVLGRTMERQRLQRGRK